MKIVSSTVPLLVKELGPSTSSPDKIQSPVSCIQAALGQIYSWAFCLWFPATEPQYNSSTQHQTQVHYYWGIGQNTQLSYAPRNRVGMGLSLFVSLALPGRRAHKVHVPDICWVLGVRQ